MTTDSLETLETLTVMEGLRHFRNERDVNWESLCEPGTAYVFSPELGDLKEISERVGEP